MLCLKKWIGYACGLIITAGLLSGCGQTKMPDQTIAFSRQSFQTRHLNQLPNEIKQYTQTIPHDHRFVNQFKTSTDTSDYDQIVSNVNLFSLPTNLANDPKFGNELMSLQLLHQQPSQFDLQTLLKQNNQMTHDNIKQTIKNFHHIAPHFNWNTMAYYNAFNHFQHHLSSDRLVIQQTINYLTKQNFTNDQINNVINLINTDQKTQAPLTEAQLNQRINAQESTNQTLAQKFIQADLIKPLSKTDLYAQLINHNGFTERTIDQVIKKLHIDFKMLARLKAVQNQNQRSTAHQYDRIQLANSVIEAGFTQAEALYAASHVSNASKEQNEINAAIAKLNQKETETQKALDEQNKRQQSLKHLKRTNQTKAQYDQLAYTKLMLPYQKQFDAAQNSKTAQNRFAQKTYDHDHNYQHALIVARYWVSQIDNTNHVTLTTLHQQLTDPKNYYNFDNQLANQALHQAQREYQINWLTRGQKLFKDQKGYLTKSQIQHELKAYGYSDQMIDQITD